MIGELKEIETRARDELAAIEDEESLDRWRVAYLGRKGQPDPAPARPDKPPPGGAALYGSDRQPPEERAGRGARRPAGGGRGQAIRRHRGGEARRNPSRPSPAGGTPPPGDPDPARRPRRLRLDGLLRRRGAGGGVGLLQLRGAAHPQGPPRPRHDGHALHRLAPRRRVRDRSCAPTRRPTRCA